MATTAAAAKAPVEAPEAAPKKKSKLLPIIALTLLLLIAAGAGAWWFLGQSSADDEEVPEVASKPSIFLPLEQFTVNLQPEEGQQFLQATMTLKVSEQDIADAIKAQMPEVRSRVLFLLSSKKPSQLATVEGKNKLIEELMQEVEATLPLAKGKAKKSKKRAEDEEDSKATKKGKNKAKAKAKEEAAEAEQTLPRRVVAVYFTHFIVQ
jgi:flagellar protein FliL